MVSVTRSSQQAWSVFQNGCLGKVLHASVELVPACLEGQWWSEFRGMTETFGKWKIPLGPMVHSYAEADTPSGPPPGRITMSRGALFSCEFLFLSKMKGVRSNELLGSFYHWNSKNLLVSKTSRVKEMCCTRFSNFTFKQLLSQQNGNKKSFSRRLNI